MRRTTRTKSGHVNPLWQLYRTVSFIKVTKNFIVIELGRICPSVQLKRNMYRMLLGMTIGDKTSIAYKAMPDLMFPERITIGENSVIGYNATLLTHEYLVDEYRVGNIHIGDNVLIGANALVLPGVTIGDNSVIGAMTVVSKDVPAHAFAYGNPMIIKNKI
ncbi:acyltransferase [Macrococcus capreoli]|uniref:acyltransferase n=1 Tax=Macrococcus capreoli TaxID=2982690 RepID=UPI0021D592B2|nr:acyltransferase [Macrococcus sp. TMW 2.2395]MCU7556319.1 acyltransferase [Macrococcus sp. TMW 2.2395]